MGTLFSFDICLQDARSRTHKISYAAPKAYNSFNEPGTDLREDEGHKCNDHHLQSLPAGVDPHQVAEDSNHPDQGREETQDHRCNAGEERSDPLTDDGAIYT